MKLFFIVFAAVLAAGAVLLTGIYAKSRFDQWEYALQMCYAESNSESAAMKVRADGYMEQARSRAPLARDSSDVLAVTELSMVAVNEIQKGQKRLLEIDLKIVALLENKPFWLPLTSAEQRALADAKAATPDTNLSQLREDSLRTHRKLEATRTASTPPLPGFESDKSMKPTSGASEAERERRRKAQQHDAQQIEIRRARPVRPDEMLATPTPTKGGD